MNYSNDFIRLIKDTEKEKDFIGFGNPNAKILFVGKECALDLNNPRDKDVYERTNLPNWTHWNNNVNNLSITPDTVKEWKKTGEFNPLFPYKKDNLPLGNCTWRNYQKIINLLYPEATSDFATFHQYSFLTEFNAVVSKYSERTKVVEESIARRTEHVLSKAFFRQFPVVIVGCGHYVPQYHINLENIFDQKWVEPTINLKKNEWINIHKKDGRLLIHTRQLSMCSDELLQTIVKYSKEYL